MRTSWEIPSTSPSFMIQVQGNINISLDKFIDQHRSVYITQEQCNLRVTHQLLNERTRVGYLIDQIKFNDPELQATLAAIRKDNLAHGTKIYFE